MTLCCAVKHNSAYLCKSFFVHLQSLLSTTCNNFTSVLCTVNHIFKRLCSSVSKILSYSHPQSLLVCSFSDNVHLTTIGTQMCSCKMKWKLWKYKWTTLPVHIYLGDNTHSNILNSLQMNTVYFNSIPFKKKSCLTFFLLWLGSLFSVNWKYLTGQYYK